MHTPKVIIHRLDSPRRFDRRSSRRRPSGLLRSAAAVAALLGCIAAILPDDEPMEPAGLRDSGPASLAATR